MMTDIKYDPELPFAVIIREAFKDHTILGRFHSWFYADQFAKTGTALREIVDTTPKPKIPEDADYLIWEFEGETNMAYRYDNDWYASGEWWTTQDLEEALKDAKVTVLVRKEDSIND